MHGRMKQWTGYSIGVIAAILAGVAGCKKADEAKPVPPPVADVKKDNAGKIIAAQPVGLVKPATLLPFNDAVILDPPPKGELQPPDKTHTGKNAVKIFESIANDLWNKTTFTGSGGKPIRYQAIIATELGDIHIDLLGNAAPNHVRSFVCLARTGYYDGMAFYYSPNRRIEDDVIAYIETGCPRGTRELGSGSIGYWLRPEIADRLTHEAGVVGASIGEDPDSAACRFHILAEPMPQLDGRFTVFGKVTRGLDIVRTINKREVRENDMLKQPVDIHSVKIVELPN